MHLVNPFGFGKNLKDYINEIIIRRLFRKIKRNRR